MKCFIPILIYFLFLNTLKSQCPVPIIISPNGDEELISESDFEIQFDYGIYDGYDDEWNSTIAYFYYSIDEGNNWILEDTILIDTSVLATNPIISYNWDIPILNSNNCLIKIHKYEWGCWDESDNTFNINISMSSTSYSLENKAKIFPNPAILGQVINIELERGNKESYEIELLDLNGKLIQKHSNIKGELGIKTDNIKSGTYILLVKTNLGIKSQKLVIL